jgi:hypothetical protein
MEYKLFEDDYNYKSYLEFLQKFFPTLNFENTEIQPKFIENYEFIKSLTKIGYYTTNDNFDIRQVSQIFNLNW